MFNLQIKLYSGCQKENTNLRTLVIIMKIEGKNNPRPTTSKEGKHTHTHPTTTTPTPTTTTNNNTTMTTTNSNMNHNKITGINDHWTLTSLKISGLNFQVKYTY